MSWTCMLGCILCWINHNLDKITTQAMSWFSHSDKKYFLPKIFTWLQVVSSCSTYPPNSPTDENSEKLRWWEEKGIARHFLQWEISLEKYGWFDSSSHFSFTKVKAAMRNPRISWIVSHLQGSMSPDLGLAKDFKDHTLCLRASSKCILNSGRFGAVKRRVQDILWPSSAKNKQAQGCSSPVTQ